VTEHDRLLGAVLDVPADDAPRLVYADWLHDHGEEERAAFIRAQIEVAGLEECDPRYPEALARSRRAATFAFGASRPWVDHVPDARVVFRRGVISRAVTEADHFLRQPPQGWLKVPLEELVLFGSGEPVGPRLAARRDLARLRLLALGGNWPTERARPLLCGCRHLAGLRELCLDALVSGEEGEEEPTTADLDLPALEALSWQAASAQDWPPFVGGLACPLERLILQTSSDPDLDAHPDPWQWLTSSRHWPALRQVNLWHHINTIGYSSVYETPRLPDFAQQFPALRARDVRLSVSQLPDLAAERSWGELHTLRVGHADLTDDLAPLRARQAKQLTRLFLDYPDGPEPDLADARPDVLASPHLANLRHLRIGSYHFTSDDVPGIVAGRYRQGLLTLELGQSAGYLDTRQVKELLAKPFPQLRTLRLGLKSVKDLLLLCATRNLPNLCTLVIDNWELTEEMLQALAQAPRLPHLSLVAEAEPVAGPSEWLLGGGTATKVPPSLALRETDVLEDGPYK